MTENINHSDGQLTSNRNLEDEMFFNTLKAGTLREDFEIKVPDSDLYLATGIFEEGKITYMNALYAIAMNLEIETQRVVYKGEKLAIVPRTVIYPGFGRVCVIPISWYKKELEKYSQTHVLPKGLIYVAVPEELVVETDANISPSVSES